MLLAKSRLDCPWEHLQLVLANPRNVLAGFVEVVEVVAAVGGLGPDFGDSLAVAEVGLGGVELEVLPFVVALHRVEHVSDLQRGLRPQQDGTC